MIEEKLDSGKVNWIKVIEIIFMSLTINHVLLITKLQEQGFLRQRLNT